MSCAYTPATCSNPDHDHHDENGKPLTCDDCGLPLHWSEAVQDYRHDDRWAAPCFLVPA